MSKLELLPCPFCNMSGHGLEINKPEFPHHRIHCLGCNATFQDYSTAMSENGAKKKWNTRPREQDMLSEIHKLREVIQGLMQGSKYNEERDNWAIRTMPNDDALDLGRIAL